MTKPSAPDLINKWVLLKPIGSLEYCHTRPAKVVEQRGSRLYISLRCTTWVPEYVTDSNGRIIGRHVPDPNLDMERHYKEYIGIQTVIAVFDDEESANQAAAYGFELEVETLAFLKKKKQEWQAKIKDAQP